MGRLTATSDATGRSISRRLRYPILHVSQRKTYILRVVRVCAVYSKHPLPYLTPALGKLFFYLSLAPSSLPSMVFMCISTMHPWLSDVLLQGPQEQSVGQITQFQKMFLSPGFLAYGSVLIAASLIIIFYFGPRYVGSCISANKV